MTTENEFCSNSSSSNTSWHLKMKVSMEKNYVDASEEPCNIFCTFSFPGKKLVENNFLQKHSESNDCPSVVDVI